MASAEFDADTDAKRPTVQVGDPYVEKLLIEACLELMATDAIVAIQDMGAAGLTSSAVEMAGKGGVGIELDLDAVPQREAGMSAYEMMLSESQERMLMVLRPDREDVARAVFEKWELEFAVIGRITDTGRIVLRHRGVVEADIALDPLAEQAPLYHRPTEETPRREALGEVADPVGVAEALLALVGCPDLCSRAWVWDQYDSTVGGQTVRRPGGADAAVVRVAERRALALTTDCTPRYCFADPEAGGAQAVAEAWRNLTAVGAMPLAITDNMNFGNPEKPEIMGQFAACIRGMAAACVALDFPVVSGNVSLYNETRGHRDPADAGDRRTGGARRRGRRGRTGAAAGAGAGAGGRDGRASRAVALAARAVRARGRAAAAGRPRRRAGARGLRARRDPAPARWRRATTRATAGCWWRWPRWRWPGTWGRAGRGRGGAGGAAHAWWFGEDQARYVLASAHADALLEHAAAAGVPARGSAARAMLPCRQGARPV